MVDHVVADLAAAGLADPDRTGTALGIASAQAWRYVAEMEEIAATQAEAGLTPDLFRAMGAVYAELAERAVAASPEDVPDGLPLEMSATTFALVVSEAGGASVRAVVVLAPEEVEAAANAFGRVSVRVGVGGAATL